MKKILILLAISMICVSCKKQKDELTGDDAEVLSDVTINILIAYNDSTVYDVSDSALVKVYDGTTLIQTAYTFNGKVAVVPVKRGGKYYFTFETRTYNNGGGYLLHYEGKWDMEVLFYGVDTNKSRNYFKNYYVCVGGGRGASPGKGTTNIAIIDPFEKTTPFKVW